MNALLMSKDYRDAHDALAQLPAVDAVPVAHGKWKQANKKEAGYYCPFCLIGNTLYPRLYRYCYYCGVKMDGCERADASTCGPDYCEIGGDTDG